MHYSKSVPNQTLISAAVIISSYLFVDAAALSRMRDAQMGKGENRKPVQQSCHRATSRNPSALAVFINVRWYQN